MRPLRNKTNVIPPDGDYQFGRIKDNPGDNTGTPVNELLYGDIHQFFEKLMLDAGLVANGLPEQGYSGYQLNQALDILRGNRKVLNIGNWNMDSSGTFFVPHGIADPKKIRTIQVIVRDDTDVFYEDLTARGLGEAGISTWVSGTNVELFRAGSGHFDSPSYSAAPGGNRGWVTITWGP